MYKVPVDEIAKAVSGAVTSVLSKVAPQSSQLEDAVPSPLKRIKISKKGKYVGSAFVIVCGFKLIPLHGPLYSGQWKGQLTTNQTSMSCVWLIIHY